MSAFRQSVNKLNSLTEDAIYINELPVSTCSLQDSKPISVPAMNENIEKQTSGQYMVDQHKIEFVNGSGEIYAEVIYHTFQSDPSVTVINWVEVCDQELWGNGLGSLLHAELITHIELNTNSTTVYTQLENDKLLSTLLNTGFQQINIGGTDPWYVLYT